MALLALQRLVNTVQGMVVINLILLLLTAIAAHSEAISLKFVPNKLAKVSLQVVVALGVNNGMHARADDRSGAALFTQSCVGCHAGGGNILPFQGGKNLKKATLEKDGYYDASSMSQLILKGKAQMPAFGEFMGSKGNMIPARFSDAEVKEISEFVLKQADLGWPQ